MRKRLWFSRSLRSQLILLVVLTMSLFLIANILLFRKVNQTLEDLDSVYATNLQLNELSHALIAVHENTHDYLNTRSTDALIAYKNSYKLFKGLILDIEDIITDHPAKKRERLIRNMALSYCDVVGRAVNAKMAYDVAGYQMLYGEARTIYRYLQGSIRSLDMFRFEMNSANYGILYRSLTFLEIFMACVLVCLACYVVVILYLLMKKLTQPLIDLAEKARLLGEGNLDIELAPVYQEDEVGTVTRAFNHMIVSLKDYIRRMQEGLELENRMKQKELEMESLLKDAQLRYYQEQINPHFLFNTLNAGQQLAMMEDAGRTYTFMNNLSSFFRYRLRKNGEESTIRDELGLVDNYMHIMNVRYSGEISVTKEVDTALLDMPFPGMILQPIVENACSHGLTGVEWQKTINIVVQQEGMDVCLIIKDNGHGMSAGKLEELRMSIEEPARRDASHGVGLRNSRDRLVLHYGQKNVFFIDSPGEGQGTIVTIRIPWENTPSGERNV